MTKLRSNVELCLSVEGAGTLVAGWVFQTDVGRIKALLNDGSGKMVDLASTWVRFPRPDVVDCFGASVGEAVRDANRDAGFIAFAPSIAGRSALSGPRLELCLGDDKKNALVVQLNPDQLTEPLDPVATVFLRHNLRPLLEILRRHHAHVHQSFRTLIEALGPDGSQLARSTDGGPTVGLELCAHSVDEGLLVAGWVAGAAEAFARAELAAGTETFDLLPFMHFLSEHDGVAGARRRFVVAVPHSVVPRLPQRVRMHLVFVDGHAFTTDARVSSGREALSRFGEMLDAETWLALSEAVAEHWPEPGRVAADSIAQALRLLARKGHEATRHVVMATQERIAAAIDRAFIVPNLGVLTIGWLLDPDQQVSSLHAHFGGGPAPDVLPDAARMVRPDIRREYERWLENVNAEGFGFVFLARTQGMRPEAVESSLYYTVRTRSGTRRRLRTPALRRCEGNPLPMIREILGFIPTEDFISVAGHVGPVVETLWRNRPESNNREAVFDVGEQVKNPAVSIIVPIYGRHDYIEYQLSLFADDPDLADAELIYVIDDPRIADEALRACRELYPLFKVPVRVVPCRQNRGFAAANNIGVAAARGRLLLLLNSDVMPRQRGWLSELVRLHDSLPNPGAIGPKLLFPDGSLQHAGMHFEQVPHFPGLWLNGHPGKGFPTQSAPRDTLLPVPAVTAACLMVSREVYERVGGLDESYILGDFEDSDFCLKLRKAGGDIRCAAGIELYHLERQSQRLIGTNEWRFALTLYNAWFHTKRWDDSIRKLAQGVA